MILPLSYLRNRLSLLRLIGPIFDKELRVSSRRRRHYVLRSLYLLLLLIFISIVWSNIHVSGVSASIVASQMSMAGTQVIAMVVVFQFVVLQLLAVSMLSTAISDEISHQTLGVLMTTPINSFQIVMGKLLSKVFQLLLMAGITLPILAMLRVFGGVPWGFILASVCVTFTTVLFAGALSLLFSVRSRQAHGVIIRTLFILFLMYGVLPGTSGIVLPYYLADVLSSTALQNLMIWVMSVMTLVSPWMQMSYQTARVLQPGTIALPLASYWGFHCLIMLGMTMGLLAWAVYTVRRVGLSQAVGQLQQDRKGRWKPVNNRNESQAKTGIIRRVRGACVIWKELRSPLIQGGKKKAWVGFIIAVAVQIGLYVYYGRYHLLQENFTHMWCIGVFMLIGLIGSIFLAATTITSEKETRTWPLLLSTTLNDGQILWGKAVGTFRRCLPVWTFLAGHLVLFVLLGYLHVAVLLIMSMIVVWVIVFLSGTGLYFGSRCRKTSSAVMCNLAVILLLWLVLPAVFGVLTLLGKDSAWLNTVSFANPMTQSFIAMEGLAGSDHAAESWRQLRFRMLNGTFIQSGAAFLRVFSVYSGVYVSIGLVLMALAKRRIRKGIYQE